MPEANILYSVTGAVIVGLVFFVAVVLRTAKEPWGRAVPHGVVDLPPEAEAPGAAAVPEEEAKPRVDADEADDAAGAAAHPTSAAKIGADSTSKATPVALAKEKEEEKRKSESATKAAAEAEAESDADAEKKKTEA